MRVDVCNVDVYYMQERNTSENDMHTYTVNPLRSHQRGRAGEIEHHAFAIGKEWVAHKRWLPDALSLKGLWVPLYEWVCAKM